MYTGSKHDAACSQADPNSAHPERQSFVEVLSQKQGRPPALGIALTIPSTVVAQFIGATGCDFAFIDMEHDPLSPELATQSVHAIVASSRGSCHPFIRVPSHGVEWMKWALDSGAAGIVVPMVENRAEMEAIVERALYPPLGKRSLGPSRAPWGLAGGPQRGVEGYFEQARKGEVVILPMIESSEGVKNVDDILRVQGVHGVFVGPVDLRLSLGLVGADGSEPVYTRALETICQAAKRNCKVVGSIGFGTEAVRSRVQEGMDFIVVSADGAVLASGFKGDLETAKGAASRGSIPSL